MTQAEAISELLEAVGSASPIPIWELDTQELANTAWAFAKMAAEDPELQEAVRSAAPGKIHRGHPAGPEAITVRACATQAVEHSELPRVTSSAAISKI